MKYKYIIISILISFIINACSSKQSEIKTPSKSLTITVNGVDFDMIFIEGGTFNMGCTPEQENEASENEKPMSQVTVGSFYLGKHEVTQKLWNAVIGSEHNHSNNTNCDNCPIENVSWDDAQAFIAKLTILTGKKFRLPLEAEWEYAARGGNQSQKYKYSGSNNIAEVAWFINNYKQNSFGDKKTTHPVGLKKGNELGLYDMSGNVWEWCEDLYKKEYIQNNQRVHKGWPFPGTFIFFRRILRGGSWGGEATGCRVSCIDFDFASYKDEFGGFRIAMDL